MYLEDLLVAGPQPFWFFKCIPLDLRICFQVKQLNSMANSRKVRVVGEVAKVGETQRAHKKIRCRMAIPYTGFLNINSS